MQTRPDAKVFTSTEGLYYSLCEGYLKPEDYLTDPRDIHSVNEALKTLDRFFNILRLDELVEEC